MNKKTIELRKQYNKFVKEHYTMIVWVACIAHLLILPFAILFNICYIIIAALNYGLIIHPCELCEIPVPKWSQKIEDFDKLL